MAERVATAEELLERYAKGERDFGKAELRAANLSWVKLHGANLSGANLREANLHWTSLRGADVRGSDLSGANLSKVTLTDANLSGASLREVNLQGAVLYGVNLSEASLRDANLQGAVLQGANLSGADLRGADLRGADLSGMNLHDADWSEVVLSEIAPLDADVCRVDLRGADLRGANLSGANLSGAMLTGAELAEARLDNCTLTQDADLLVANWKTLEIGDTTYHRDAVERGEQVLRIGERFPSPVAALDASLQDLEAAGVLISRELDSIESFREGLLETVRQRSAAIAFLYREDQRELHRSMLARCAEFTRHIGTAELMRGRYVFVYYPDYDGCSESSKHVRLLCRALEIDMNSLPLAILFGSALGWLPSEGARSPFIVKLSRGEPRFTEEITFMLQGIDADSEIDLSVRLKQSARALKSTRLLWDVRDFFKGLGARTTAKEALKVALKEAMTGGSPPSR